MNKQTFKTSFHNFLIEEVDGLTSEQKLKYMKKWIRDYTQDNLEQSPGKPSETNHSIKIDSSKKVGLLVRTTLNQILKSNLLSPEKIRLLQDEKHCKNQFDINYPFLKKVKLGCPLSEQRKIKGFDRYWADPISIQNEKYLVCNDWYERNKSKFIRWVQELS